MTEIVCEGLSVPDLRPYFKHAHWRPMPHSLGVPVASDFADYPDDHEVFGLYKKCGFWTQAEAAILYNSAIQVKGKWFDIGSHTGWTAVHLFVAGCDVGAIDPMYRVDEFARRACANMSIQSEKNRYICLYADTSKEFAKAYPYMTCDGVVIDGDHDAPNPLGDAKIAESFGARLILFHDAIGEPVQEGVRYLIEQGYQHKVYWTPHVVAVLWKGEFTPPDHAPEPHIKASVSRYYSV